MHLPQSRRYYDKNFILQCLCTFNILNYIHKSLRLRCEYDLKKKKTMQTEAKQSELRFSIAIYTKVEDKFQGYERTTFKEENFTK